MELYLFFSWDNKELSFYMFIYKFVCFFFLIFFFVFSKRFSLTTHKALHIHCIGVLYPKIFHDKNNNNNQKKENFFFDNKPQFFERKGKAISGCVSFGQ